MQQWIISINRKQEGLPQVVKEKTMARMRPAWALEQGRMVGTYDPEEEVLLELTVPLAHDTEFFRIGWSLKGLRHSGWIAISTGHAVWSTRELDQASEHILNLLTSVLDVVRGGVPAERR